jgi:hypothetical protein
MCAARSQGVAPWKKVGYEAAIKVECDKFQSGPWYAVLMGQSGAAGGAEGCMDSFGPEGFARD